MPIPVRDFDFAEQHGSNPYDEENMLDSDAMLDDDLAYDYEDEDEMEDEGPDYDAEFF